MKKDKMRELWKSSDDSWNELRKRDWQVLARGFYRNESTRELANNKSYFLTGREKDILSPFTRVLLTPFSSKEEARYFLLKSNNFVSSEIRGVLSSYFEKTGSAAEAAFYREHAAIMNAAFYKNGYKSEYWISGNDDPVDVSPEPTAKVVGFLVNYIQLFRKEIDYTGNIDCVNYFYSCLPLATKSVQRKGKSELFERLFDLAEVSRKNADLSNEARWLAEELVSNKQMILDQWASSSNNVEEN